MLAPGKHHASLIQPAVVLQGPDFLLYGLICTNSIHVQPLGLSKYCQKDLFIVQSQEDGKDY